MPGLEDDEDQTPNEEIEQDAEEDENDDDLPDESESDPDSEEETPAPRVAVRKSQAQDPALTEQLMRRAIEAETQLKQVNQTEYQRNQQIEQQRLNEMSAEDRLNYNMNKLAEKQDRFQAQMLFKQGDMDDRSLFLSSISKNPKLSKYAEEVEKELTTMRKNGQNAPREAILDYVIGRAARKSLTGGSGKKQKEIGQKNLQGARNKPLSAKGNVHAFKSKKEKYAHLEKVYI